MQHTINDVVHTMEFVTTALRTSTDAHVSAHNSDVHIFSHTAVQKTGKLLRISHSCIKELEVHIDDLECTIPEYKKAVKVRSGSGCDFAACVNGMSRLHAHGYGWRQENLRDEMLIHTDFACTAQTLA